MPSDQGRACGRRRFRPQASRRDPADRRDRGDFAGRARTRQDPGGGGEIRRRARDYRTFRDVEAPGLDAVILATPTQMHAAQAIECLQAGKHVQVEIPLADSLKDAEAVVAAQKKAGLVAMVGHTRRFNPSHQFVHKRILADELHIQQMDVQTYFFRRSNMNALGQPRSWTDHLLWHHAAHTVDLFAYQAALPIVKANAIEGPIHANLGIAMDMSIQLKAPMGLSARCRCRSTTTGRSAPSSATSATPPPTSPATTIFSPARTKRSTSARSTYR